MLCNASVSSYCSQSSKRCTISNTRNSVSSGYPNKENGVFDEIRGVWIADETLSRVFDISSQSKQKLKSKRRNKFVKIYAKTGYLNLLHACAFRCFNVTNYFNEMSLRTSCHSVNNHPDDFHCTSRAKTNQTLKLTNSFLYFKLKNSPKKARALTG